MKDLERPVYHNGIYPHAEFVARPTRSLRKPLQNRVLDVGGWVATGIIVGGLFFWSVALALGGFWVLLVVLDALGKRLGG